MKLKQTRTPLLVTAAEIVEIHDIIDATFDDFSDAMALARTLHRIADSNRMSGKFYVVL